MEGYYNYYYYYYRKFTLLMLIISFAEDIIYFFFLHNRFGIKIPLSFPHEFVFFRHLTNFLLFTSKCPGVILV